VTVKYPTITSQMLLYTTMCEVPMSEKQK